MNTFLRIPFFESDECLTSYLQRLAKANYVTPNDIWRLLLREGAHYPQSSIASQLDIYPHSFIDIKKLAEMLMTEINKIENLTFITAYRKLGVPITKINRSRILSTMIVTNRKFCPECIKENLYYKLIWQVKEIEYCPIHHIKLLSICSNCGKSIPIIPSNSEIGICPSCNFNLKESLSISYNPDLEESRIIEDWSYLLDPTSCVVYSVDGLTVEQSLALRLLYFMQPHINDLDKNEKNTLFSIKQIARDTKTNQTFIHLTTIFHFIRKFNISLQHYLSLEVPKEYSDSILRSKGRMIDNYACIAPWCNHYNIPGSLERTSTSVKVLKSGDKQKYYMYCNDCGIEYSISQNKDGLIERGNFIKFAWDIVRNELRPDSRLSELSIKLKVPEDKLRRALIFLASNNLVNRELIPLKIPLSHKPSILEDMKKCIEMGIPAKSIKQKLNLNYNDFLFYWLSCDIRIANIKRVYKRPDKLKDTNERVKSFENAIDQLLAENIPITIKSVCEKLGIVPETLRSWGFLDKLKEYKAIQKLYIDKQFEANILKSVEEILNESLTRGEKISSEDLYKMLGVRRTVLVRKFPHLTKFIHSIIMTTNR